MRISDTTVHEDGIRTRQWIPDGEWIANAPESFPHTLVFRGSTEAEVHERCAEALATWARDDYRPEWRVVIRHDPDCRACGFTGGLVTSDVPYCNWCGRRGSRPMHYSRGQQLCRMCADRFGFPVLQVRHAGEWSDDPVVNPCGEH